MWFKSMVDISCWLPLLSVLFEWFFFYPENYVSLLKSTLKSCDLFLQTLYNFNFQRVCDLHVTESGGKFVKFNFSWVIYLVEKIMTYPLMLLKSLWHQPIWPHLYYVTASTSTYVTASVLSFEQFEPTPLVIKLSEFTETNKKLHAQFDLSRIMKTKEVC